MQIMEVEPIALQPRWLFVKITTDTGIVGWGECLGDRAETIARAVKELRRYLIGKNPMETERHWQAMYRMPFWRGGPVLNAAISGVDIALWDIRGKVLDAPVWELLGGKCRDKVRLYRGIGGNTPDALVNSARKAVDDGFSAVKWCPVSEGVPPLTGRKGPEDAAAQVEAVRDEFGADLDILLDFHGRLSPALGIVYAKAVEPFNPFFIEEPVLPEQSDAIPRIAAMTHVPIATGERLFTKFGFKSVIANGGVAMIQPDLCICGGLTEGKKIAAMAEAYQIGLGPHNPYGPVNSAASLHLDVCSPNFVIQEFVSLGEGIFTEPLKHQDGYLLIPDSPGLGIEVDESAVRARPYVPVDTPLLTDEDGSIVDW